MKKTLEGVIYDSINTFKDGGTVEWGFASGHHHNSVRWACSDIADVGHINVVWRLKYLPSDTEVDRYEIVASNVTGNAFDMLSEAVDLSDDDSVRRCASALSRKIMNRSFEYIIEA